MGPLSKDLSNRTFLVTVRSEPRPRARDPHPNRIGLAPRSPGPKPSSVSHGVRSLMTKRNYHRRSDDEIIADLEAKITQLQTKIEAKHRPDEPVVKELPKVRRKLASFSQLCMDHGRGDVSNSVMAFLSMLETQLRSPIE